MQNLISRLEKRCWKEARQVLLGRSQILMRAIQNFSWLKKIVSNLKQLFFIAAQFSLKALQKVKQAKVSCRIKPSIIAISLLAVELEMTVEPAKNLI